MLTEGFRAQGIPPSNATELQDLLDVLDPESEGYVTYPHYVEIAALKMNARTAESRVEEVEEAFKLFTKGANGPIHIHHLRRVARELKEDVGDDMLRTMVLEANNGAGVSKGVNMEDFQAIMTRAGVFQGPT